MKSVGVNIGGSGDSAVRLRPMLVFQKHHGMFFFCSRFINMSNLFLLSYDFVGKPGRGFQGVT
jgi:hypothetical protein